MAIFLKFEEKDFIIKIKTGDKTEDIDIRTCMKIDDGNLPKEFTEQPSMFAWHSTLLAEQEDRLATEHRDSDRRRTYLALQLRQGKLSIKDGDGNSVKLTEAGVNNYIESDSKYQSIKDKIQDLDLTCKKLKGLVNASIQRKDMLIQLGYLERQERKQFPMGSGM